MTSDLVLYFISFLESTYLSLPFRNIKKGGLFCFFFLTGNHGVLDLIKPAKFVII